MTEHRYRFDDYDNDFSIMSMTYRSGWKDITKFELKSLIGRKLLNKRPPDINNENKLLNLGCGLLVKQSWVNADFFEITPWSINRIKKLGINWMLDFRYPMNCESNYWDGVFCEHSIEHMYSFHAKKLIEEVFRTLKPGKLLRLSVPDLKKYVDDYVSGINRTEEFRKRWDNGISSLASLTQNWGHKSVWDAQLLTFMLENIGFVDVKEAEYMKGSDSRLLIDNPDRVWESCYIEARKPE